MKNTNEETVTLTREKYDGLISNLGIAIGMLRGLGVHFDREVSRSNIVVMDAHALKKITSDCRDVASTAEKVISNLHTEEPKAG
jgi:hypothetical protein